jgi:5-oxoprolinase (ATP-hydrolysing) subunit A
MSCSPETRARREIGDARPKTIDLNADCGEGMPEDDLMPLLSSASVACGAYAGGEAAIRSTLALGRRHGVTLGAHPGFPDREGFGRRVTTSDPAEIESLVVAQIALLASLAHEAGVALAFVKPHGALYNLAAADAEVATAVARAADRVLPGAPLVLLAGAPALATLRSLGSDVVAEGFADRAYSEDGRLAPRSVAGAVIDDPERCAERAVAIVRDRSVASLGGKPIALAAATLCIHGDNPRAPEIASRVRAALGAAGIRIAPFAGARRDP